MFAQSASEKNQIKAYYSNAVTALKNSEWNSAISNIDKAWEITGQNLAAYELVKLRAYWGMKDLARAQRSVSIFNTLEPNELQKRQIAAYIPSINDAINEKKNQFEDLKISDKKRRERNAKEKEKRLARERKIASVIVQKEAIEAGNEMRNIVRHNVLNGKSTASLSQTIQEPDGFTFLGDQKWKSTTLSDRVEISADNVYIKNGGYNKYSIHLQYVMRGIRDCKRAGRYNSAMFNLYLHFFKDGNQIKVGYKEDAYVNKEAFGCTTSYIGHRGDFTKQAERIGYEFLNNRIINLKNITLTEDQLIAYEKDSETFMYEFMYAITSNNVRSYEEIQEALEAKRLAKEKRAQELQKAENNLNKGKNALANDRFTEAIDYFKQVEDVYRNYNQNTNEVSQLITLTNQKHRQINQEQFNIVVNELSEASIKKDLESGYKLIEEGNQILDAFPQLDNQSNFQSLRKEVRKMIDDKEEVIDFANDYKPNESNYSDFGAEEKILKALEYDPSNTAYLEKLEQVRYLKKRGRFLYHIKEGNDKMRESSYKMAIRKFEDALTIFPNDSSALAKITVAETALKNKKESKVDLIKNIEQELQNGNKFDEKFLASIKKKVKDYVKDYPNDVELVVAATTLYINEKLGLEEAYDFTQVVLKAAPDNLQNLKNIGDIYYANNNYPEAIKYLKKAIDIPLPLKGEVLQKLTQSNYTLSLKTKEKEYENLAVQYANMGKQFNVDHPVFDRVIKRFCPANENCKN
ncbi:tetratricopeptide repeat protein [Roseivirga pacifica]|uniref:tetratricopeptide repeat protein n=1 Tax=Roseivirga pacifica TaxID=1267423 RepID=UPI00227A7B2F|nr:tetratricopeptide repeat protein [Roseivirga pacifica]